MRYKTAWRIAGDELLADGQWHSVGELHDVMAAHVPPAVAWRVREHNATSARRKANSAQPIGPNRVTPDQVVRLGSANKAAQCIGNAVRTGVWVRQGDLIRRRDNNEEET